MPELAYPRYIQRCAFDPSKERGKIEYDNMGAAEFELGSRPSSLKRIFAKGITRIETTIIFGEAVIKVEVIAGRGFNFTGYQELIQRVAVDETMRFKSAPLFREALEFKLGLKTPSPYENRFNLWFDINNDVLWSVDEGVGLAVEEELKRIKQKWDNAPAPTIVIHDL
ncbi:MAG: hypothetical protein KBC81_01160 [Candidatus Pacebacteria bacterium]|nr:hypothetical protein [Candidatus Paceibacterota bacterium]